MKAANSGLTFLDRCARRCQISRSPDVTAFFEFDEVDVFTTGTLGEPGQRVFFLQARSDGKRYSIRCEKQQVAAIVMHLRRVLTDLPPAEQAPLPVRSTSPSRASRCSCSARSASATTAPTTASSSSSRS
jgi:hypothetical protein